MSTPSSMWISRSKPAVSDLMHQSGAAKVAKTAINGRKPPLGQPGLVALTHKTTTPLPAAQHGTRGNFRNLFFFVLDDGVELSKTE